MKYLIRIAACALLMCAPTVNATIQFIECKSINRPSHSVAFSSLSKKEGDQMIGEAFKYGILDYMLEPSESWVIDLVTGRVYAPDNPDDEFIENAHISAGSIRGETNSHSKFALNRVTGMLNITKVREQMGPIVLRGIPIERVSTWKYSCSAREPAI